MKKIYFAIAFLIASATISAQCWQSVSSSSTHNLAVRNDGSLWAWGSNSSGQLGSGDGYSYQYPYQISASGWRQTSASGTSSLAIKQDGTLWAWGSNYDHQLGDGTTTSRPLPAQLGSDTWQLITSSPRYSVGIKNDGSLWHWGYGPWIDVETYPSVPEQIGSSHEWRAAAAGIWHVVLLKSDGTLWTWGGNYYGQLGVGSTLQGYASLVQIGTDNDWQSIAAGDDFVLARKSNGTLWAWGKNSSGQLGDGTTVNKIAPVQIPGNWQSVDCGRSTSLGVKTDGTLWSWGGGLNNSPTQIGTGMNWQSAQHGSQNAMTADNKLWSLITGTPVIYNCGEPDEAPDTQCWRNLNMGPYHSAGIKNDGTLWAWGTNVYGSIGDGTHISKSWPTQVGTGNDWQIVEAGSQNTFAIKNNGTLWAWGANAFALGNGSAADVFAPIQITTATNWTFIADGGRLAIKSDGTLWGWGYNFPTSGFHTPTQIGTDSDWSYITWDQDADFSSGNYLGIKTNGTLWGWGRNNYVLGDNTAEFKSFPTQIGTQTWRSVKCRSSFAFALKTDGTLWSWGSNLSGQLGDGTTTAHNIPAQIGTDNNWSSIAIGSNYAIAVKTDGTLWAWGASANGLLGNGTPVSSTVPIRIGTASNWQSIDAANNVIGGLKTNHTAYSWGNNGNGQLGNGQDSGGMLMGQITCADHALATEEVAEIGNNVSVYPNPASKILNIKSSHIVDRIALYNSLGSKVLESKTNLSEINIESLQNGLYLLQIYSEGHDFYKKIIKN